MVSCYLIGRVVGLFIQFILNQQIRQFQAAYPPADVHAQVQQQVALNKASASDARTSRRRAASQDFPPETVIGSVGTDRSPLKSATSQTPAPSPQRAAA
jgi:hypothetical protein